MNILFEDFFSVCACFMMDDIEGTCPRHGECLPVFDRKRQDSRALPCLSDLSPDLAQ